LGLTPSQGSLGMGSSDIFSAAVTEDPRRNSNVPSTGAELRFGGENNHLLMVIYPLGPHTGHPLRCRFPPTALFPPKRGNSGNDARRGL
jgi:hypothetical protein